MKNGKIKHSRKMKMTAVMLMAVFICELVHPTIVVALTSGPTQPEVTGFEPVGTTDMVDMFSGSFVYNIPLLDVEGYPVNISYHGGVTMEQEASWVGLGWSINPGVINRSVRGVPDDFNGDKIHKDVNILPEKTLRVGIGASLEFFGSGSPFLNANFNLGPSINISNYRGVSCDLSFGGGINVFHSVSAGVNMGVGSQTGASIDPNASLSLSSSQLLSKDHAHSASGSISAGIGGGYNTRSGLKDLNLSFSGSMKYNNHKPHVRQNSSSFSSGANIPIGISNYVPVITNSSEMNTIYGRIKLGFELWGGYAHGHVNGMFSKLTYNNDATRNAYGYLYMQNAAIESEDILDFTRDKDGMFNKSMQYLPVPNMTYDVYSLSGQGTAGVFRPFRNDFGSVYDPVTSSSSKNYSFQGEYGVGNLFEAGLDYSKIHTDITSGPWQSFQRKGRRDFRNKVQGSVFENVFFKQGGELTVVDSNYFQAIGGLELISPNTVMALPEAKPFSLTKRDPRANIIYYHTAQEAESPGVSSEKSIKSYKDISHLHPGDEHYIDVIRRIGDDEYQHKKDEISEIVQVQNDGRKYIYGIPAMNNVQREMTFSVDNTNAINLGDGTVSFGGSDATNNNEKGKEHYYSSTTTPSYAHSYLLTQVLSNDYVDVTGDGVSDDDLGSYTKFNYTLTDKDYRWVAPFSTNFNLAQYNPGFWCDKTDDKANLVTGSREQWNMHSIETKNQIAEFYISRRDDAVGIGAPILNHGDGRPFDRIKESGPAKSYKLDSIKLYNKHDRFVNAHDAIPIKSVYFVYDYSLCIGVPNSSSGGKLTLQRIYFSYGTSKKSMISPYQFRYGFNPSYNLAEKDRWGCYKVNNPSFTNYEFPYVDQTDTTNDDKASAWSLVEISLPSGGIIKADYESNDYAFVQDKPANEMFMLQGIGISPNYIPGSQLYLGKNNPCLYTYFKRRRSSELTALSFAQNYMGRDYQPNGKNCLYFNFNLQLTSATNSFEQIKGYVNVLSVGICPNNTDYGYLLLEATTPQGGGALLNPITYTAINTARYNLPQIMFPGQNPDESNLKNVLAGLGKSFQELFSMGKSPVLRLIEGSAGKTVNLVKSYIRLQNVGLNKEGSGQRVKALYFYDQWNELAGNNEHGAYYGKQYVYKTIHPDYGLISSGVASYEPLVGGDENPFRQPVKYTVQSSSRWPPNESIDLYQEMPIGESLFPAGQVGYSEVTVNSVHKNEGRSSKSLDRYEFYTAKDFPLQVMATGLNSNSTNKYGFFSQKNLFTATQGYTITFNDMHGKPKKVEHDVYNAATGLYKPVSYQIYKYRQNGNKLDNKVNCFVNESGNMVLRSMQLGIEEDVTLDSREKREFTRNSTLNANLNLFVIPLVIPYFVYFPFAFPWINTSETKFQSAVVSKVIQQYGILDNVESYNEGAKTILHNEVYDQITGQPVVTSVNNEFKDREYTTNIPAWWVYGGMSGSYSNIDYRDTGTITINSNYIGTLNIGNTAPLYPGDYLSISYRGNAGERRYTTAWVMGGLLDYSSGGGPSCSGVSVLPRFPESTADWHANSELLGVKIRVISSGHKNMLHENAESYTSLLHPTYSGSVLSTSLAALIDLKASTFSDSNTRIIPRYISNHDTINPYAIGERGQWRLLSEYAYHTDRQYGTTSRTSGLFNATSLFRPTTSSATPCEVNPYNYLQLEDTSTKWRKMRTVTKWSPYGKEVENIDAIGNYSTAVFGYKEELPIAVASNAKQGEVLSLGFEDYNLLHPINDVIKYNYFEFTTDNTVPLPILSIPSYSMTNPKDNINSKNGHTGMHSYFAYNNHIIMPLPIRNDQLGIGTNKYNSYFSNTYGFTSANAYLSFAVRKKSDYILSYWIKEDEPLNNITDYVYLGSPGVNVYTDIASYHFPVVKKTNIIDGWQQLECRFRVAEDATRVDVFFPEPFYVDDLRIFPADANMKAFVYGPVNRRLRATNQKLMATLDENNFATMYEYDHEGNLIRVKKETAKGIITVSESRSGNPKKILP